ncbi:hypothetical protein H4217_009359, partial [Coemansia sp. RSA 1939]
MGQTTASASSTALAPPPPPPAHLSTGTVASSSSSNNNNNSIAGVSGTSAHSAMSGGGSGSQAPPLAGALQMGDTSGGSMHGAYHGHQSEASPFSGVYENVRGYYSRFTPINKMQTSIGPTISPHPLIRDAISKVPKPVRDRFYGCGTPLPTGIEGLRVLDLGCGAGRDCYVAAKLVGPSGEVIGIDMTDEQLRVAREFVGEYSKVLGYQPHLR